MLENNPDKGDSPLWLYHKFKGASPFYPAILFLHNKSAYNNCKMQNNDISQIHIVILRIDDDMLHGKED